MYTKVLRKILSPPAQNVKLAENLFTFDDNEYETLTKRYEIFKTSILK